MPLTTGSRLGPYEVVALIGVGGMGEVYRARDTKLKRDVALKVLPDAFAQDAERMARFEREAQLLAALNHPNIAAIYGLEESGGVRALVMELVEGPTLAEVIANVGRALSGPPAKPDPASPQYVVSGLSRTQAGLPLNETLAIARQIADAFEAAHEQGIMHRDLKPANVKVRPDGVVKVLDFGLAKALAPVAQGLSPALATNSPTITNPAMMTGAGVILGTAAYMAPEQARGKEVDKRADIWAFGCVLYEMLTGTRAFGGDEISDTLAFIITKEPDWTALPADTPAPIRKLLRRCLEKDRKGRLADIADARFEIDEAQTMPEAGGSTASALVAGGSTGPALRTAGWRRAMPWAVAVVALAIGAFALWAGAMEYLQRTPVETPAYRASILLPENLTFASTLGATNAARWFALSPDGGRLVFVGAGQDGRAVLWIRSLDTLSAQPVPGTDGAAAPFWSPDGRWIGFSAGGKFKKVAIVGGTPVDICDAPGFVGTATWNRDGIILFGISPGGIQRVFASGGAPAPVTTPDTQAGELGHGYPFFLPDDRHFVYVAVGQVGQGSSGVWVGSLNSKERKLLLRSDSNAVYADRHLIFTRGSTLMAQPLNLQRLELEGEATPLAEQVQIGASPGASVAGGRGGAFSASGTGVVAYQSGSSLGQLAWVDRAGKELARVGEPQDRLMGPADPALSPDERRVAIARPAQTGRDLWLIEMARNVTTRFTFGAGDDSDPVWSPDSSSVAFKSNPKGVADLYLKPASGAGAEMLLLESPHGKIPLDWSPDGRFLLYSDADPKTGRDLWVLPMTGDRKPSVFTNTSFSEWNGQFSPDERWVAYQSDESGRNEVYVRPFPADGGTSSGQWQVSTNGGIMPRWRRDGRELYYVAGDAKVMAVPIQTSGKTFEAGAPVPLFQTQIVGGLTATSRTAYAVAADGRFLIFNAMGNQSAAPTITLVLNWPALLKK